VVAIRRQVPLDEGRDAGSGADTDRIAVPLAADLPRARRVRLLAYAERNGLLVGALGFYAIVVLLALPQELVQDTWLTLVSGREVVEHGLPHRDALFAWTAGRPWVDQQWLAQVLLYGLDRVGGMRVVAAANVVLLVTTAAVALAVARRRASARAVFAVALVCLLVAPWGLQLRAQSFAELLFVLVLALLVDEKPPAGRRLAVLAALLVVWANVHGTVVLGAALVALRGVTLLGERRRLGLALVLGAPLCAFASPYGTSLAGYYHRLLYNPLLPHFLNEWRTSAPSRATAPFYLALALAAWLLVRHGRRLALFDRLALLLLGAAGIWAIRSIVWFALAAVVLLPAALDGALERSRVLTSRRASLLASTLGPSAALLAVVLFARPTAWLLAPWPSAAAERAAAAAGAHGLVLADERHADWLLWKHPELRGRIAYDVRFELFRDADFQRLLRARRQGPAPGYAAVVGTPHETLPAGMRVIFRGGSARVSVRPGP
jgi:hypothetical protein